MNMHPYSTGRLALPAGGYGVIEHIIIVHENTVTVRADPTGSMVDMDSGNIYMINGSGIKATRPWYFEVCAGE